MRHLDLDQAKYLELHFPSASWLSWQTQALRQRWGAACKATIPCQPARTAKELKKYTRMWTLSHQGCSSIWQALSHTVKTNLPYQQGFPWNTRTSSDQSISLSCKVPASQQLFWSLSLILLFLHLSRLQSPATPAAQCVGMVGPFGCQHPAHTVQGMWMHRGKEGSFFILRKKKKKIENWPGYFEVYFCSIPGSIHQVISVTLQDGVF